MDQLHVTRQHEHYPVAGAEPVVGRDGPGKDGLELRCRASKNVKAKKPKLPCLFKERVATDPCCVD